jgi:WD40 repeat protein
MHVNLSGDGRFLAYTFLNTEIVYIGDVETGNSVAELEIDSVPAIVFNPVNNRLFVGGAGENPLILWDWQASRRFD